MKPGWWRTTVWLMVVVLPAGAATAAAAGGKVVWEEEFAQPAGTGPDAAKWTFDLGNSDGWGNDELEDYTADRANCFVTDDPAAGDGKALVIRALRTADGKYTSARIRTSGKFACRYGRIEARLRLPRGKGLWPAFWMLGASLPATDWPECGEIDIMESKGQKPGWVSGTAHGPGYSGNHGLHGEVTLPPDQDLWRDYHVYAVVWTPGRIEWQVDGKPYYHCAAGDQPAGRRWVYDDGPFFILLNVAVGGGWSGLPDATTEFPQEMRIDYVRVTALPEAPAAAPPRR